MTAEGASERSPRLVRAFAAAATALLCAALAVTGLLVLRSSGEADAAPDRVLTVVPLMPVEEVPHAVLSRRFVGRIEAAEARALAFERAGRLAEVTVDEGDAMQAGRALASLDVEAIEIALEGRRAGRRALEAQLELAELTARRREALEARGVAPAQAADEARLEAARLRAQIAEADAAIDALFLDKAKSVLEAPYDGRVGERHADPGAMLSAGAPVLSILQDAPPRLRVGVPPEIAEGLSPGGIHEVEFGQMVVDATVLHIRPDLDARTLTQAVVLELDMTGAVDGLTGALMLAETILARGAWVPLSALREGERGLWTVLAAGPDGVLGAVAVETLLVEGDRAFVSGAFEPGLRIVAEGTHLVGPGDAVVPAGR